MECTSHRFCFFLINCNYAICFWRRCSIKKECLASWILNISTAIYLAQQICMTTVSIPQLSLHSLQKFGATLSSLFDTFLGARHQHWGSLFGQRASLFYSRMARWQSKHVGWKSNAQHLVKCEGNMSQVKINWIEYYMVLLFCRKGQVDDQGSLRVLD